MGAVGIADGLKLDADLYIAGEFPGSRTLAEKLKKYSYFANVYVADSKIVSGTGKLASIKMTFFAEKAVSTYMPKDISYNRYFVTSRSTLKSSQLGVLRKRNPNITRVVFEDGLGTYSNNGSLFRVSGLRRKIEKVLRWDLDDPKKIRMMAYLPELVKVPGFLQGIKVEQMPRLQIDPKTRDLFFDIFSVEREQSIFEQYIIFDTKRRGAELDVLTQEEKDLLDSCYTLVTRYAGEDVICKPHPKSTEQPGCLMKSYDHQGVPMEVLYMDMPDLENRVLISHVSSAVFTPKIFLDCEPVVICLHKILKDSRISKNFTEIYEKFRGTYRQPERVMAPSSMEELEEMLSHIVSGDAKR